MHAQRRTGRLLGPSLGLTLLACVAGCVVVLGSRSLGGTLRVVDDDTGGTWGVDGRLEEEIAVVGFISLATSLASAFATRLAFAPVAVGVGAFLAASVLGIYEWRTLDQRLSGGAAIDYQCSTCDDVSLRPDGGVVMVVAAGGVGAALMTANLCLRLLPSRPSGQSNADNTGWADFNEDVAP